MQIEVCGVQRELAYRIIQSQSGECLLCDCYVGQDFRYHWRPFCTRRTVQEIIALLPEEHR